MFVLQREKCQFYSSKKVEIIKNSEEIKAKNKGLKRDPCFELLSEENP